MLTLSQHAQYRCAQRGIARNGIYAAYRFGRRYPRPDGTAIFHLDHYMAYRAAQRHEVDVYAFVGTAAVVEGDLVLTAFRVNDETARQRWQQ